MHRSYRIVKPINGSRHATPTDEIIIISFLHALGHGYRFEFGQRVYTKEPSLNQLEKWINKGDPIVETLAQQVIEGIESNTEVHEMRIRAKRLGYSMTEWIRKSIAKDKEEFYCRAEIGK